MSESSPTSREERVEVDLSDPEFYLNRELSELEFQRRVLHEGADDRNPLLERVRFLAYVTKNLDEFFMKRVGGLKQQIDAGVTVLSPDGLTPQAQWDAVLETARPMFDRQTAVWEDDLRPALADAGIHVYDYDELDASRQASLREYFEESILPTLTPLTFDPAHPFPFISNLSLSLAVLSASDGDDPIFTRIKVPQNQPRLVEIGVGDEVDERAGRNGQEARGYVLLEDVIERNLDLLLPNVEILDVSKFRITRNAEIRRNEEVAEDLIDMIQDVLDQRRFATVVRLEVADDMPEYSLSVLKEQLDLRGREVFHRPGLIDYRDLFELTDLDRPDLRAPPWTPQPHPRLESGRRYDFDERSDDIFAEIKRGDILVHHPYHSFEDTVQRFLETAASDPDVLAVKAAIYRTASDSKIIQSLIEAADNGKQVAVMVELKARFDEQNNLEWVRKLEEEGIHVAYGTVGLKTHTKTALVVRKEDDGVTLYSHIGTGNYHSETAKGYVDLGILTADRDTGKDLMKVFNFFTGPTLDEEFRKLLIAPVTMRAAFTEYIRREADHARAGRRARIVVKANALEDPQIVEELYEASMAGVDVDLVIRDICRLRPGLDGVSDTVDVYSVVGRFLEHSRIFYFENAGDPEWYIGSADWMTRNLDNRVEAITPVDDRDIRRQLRFVFETIFTDNRRRWVMHEDGTYTQLTPDEGDDERDTQSILMERTLAAREGGGFDDLSVAAIPDEERLLVEPISDAHPETGGWSEPDGRARTDRRSQTDGRTRTGGETLADSSATTDDSLPDAFARHPDRWYVPDSAMYDWAVRTSEGERRYYKSAESAAERLEAEYE